MKKVIALLALVAMSSAFAATVTNTGNSKDLATIPVIRNQLGTGTPASRITVGNEVATYVDDGYYHIPQYMPSFPTAREIWPRVVNVECDKVHGEVVCDGYHWTPAMGRGEYIMIIPHLRDAPVQPKPIIVYKEVPIKKKGE
jgi:hypothetical protein